MAADDESGTVELAWDANPESDIAGYRVHYGTTSGYLDRIATTSTTPTAILSGLEPGALYHCAVLAFNTAGLESPLSPEITFVAPGAANFPEIFVERAGGSILTDGQTGVSLAKVDLGSTGAAETFFIKNLGTGYLTGLAITTDGEEFTVAPLSTSTLAPGETASFKVTFRPVAAGNRVAAIRIISNDVDESPFDIGLVARGVAVPEIAIQHPLGSDLVDAYAAVNFSNSLLGSSGTAETFTLKNTGTADLTGLAISLTGAASGDFILGAPAVSILAPGASVNFTIAFKPSLPGIRSASLHITSNDADESPFDIALTGNGIALPDISITQAGGSGLTGGLSSVSLGSVNLGTTSIPQTFTISNLGTASLSDLGIAVRGPHNADFLVEPIATNSLPQGTSTTFQVTFKPTAAGPRTATLHITSNDPDESPFFIDLTGYSIALPEITVLADGTALTSGSATLDLGPCELGAPSPTRSITIKNTGTAALTGLAIASGTDFKTSNLGATTLAPGATTTFKVSFAPSAAGARAATLAIASNDADESPFLIALTGTGTVAPEIVAQHSNGKTLVDGNTFINFGTTNVGTTAKPQTFTIRNTGTAALTGLTLLKNGIHPGDFTVTDLKTQTLAPGATTTFKVAFKSTKVGTRWAALHIISNDADESSFDIILTGTGRKSQTPKTPTPKTAAPHTRLANPTRAIPPPVTGIAVIDGRKYRTLTITKTTGTTILPRHIEVSSDLVAWASGHQHTTVLRNTPETLTVRDNTPLLHPAKRHIRLNPSARARATTHFLGTGGK